MFKNGGEYDHESTKRWLKHVPGGDMFALNLVVVPVALGVHWTLCVADIPKQAKSISGFASLLFCDHHLTSQR
jgi:Ulp1 family protease